MREVGEWRRKVVVVVEDSLGGGERWVAGQSPIVRHVVRRQYTFQKLLTSCVFFSIESAILAYISTHYPLRCHMMHDLQGAIPP